MNLATSVLSLVSWCLLGYTVLAVDPSAPMAPLAFYAALFVAMTCTLGRLLAGGAVTEEDGTRVWPKPNLGHAAIVSVVLLFALWLQSLRMLSTLNGVLLAMMLLLIEFGFFLTGGRPKPRPRRRLRRIPSRRDLGISGEQ